MSNDQKFHRGDLVLVSKSIPSHFPGDGQKAIVIGSYADQFGSDRTEIYTLLIRGEGANSWYDERVLTLLESSRLNLLNEWQTEIDQEYKTKSDIDWIFSHGPEVLIASHGASIKTLAQCIGVRNLWGDHGEGISYYTNAMRVLTMAQPFLVANDKMGWLAFCDKHPKISTVDYVIE